MMQWIIGVEDRHSGQQSDTVTFLKLMDSVDVYFLCGWGLSVFLLEEPDDI